MADGRYFSERDFLPVQWSSFLAEGIKVLILMINPLSCGFASHLDNPADRCIRALLLKSVPNEIKW